MNILAIIYIGSIILYFYFLRLNTIRKTDWGVTDNQTFIFAMGTMFIPIVNLMLMVAFVDTLYELRPSVKEWWSNMWRYILMIKKT